MIQVIIVKGESYTCTLLKIFEVKGRALSCITMQLHPESDLWWELVLQDKNVFALLLVWWPIKDDACW